MSTVWDDLMESAKNLADKAGKATDKAVVYSKMKYQSMQLASDLRGLYEKLGNAVYTMAKSDFDNKDLIDSIIAEIDDVKKRLEELNVKWRSSATRSSARPAALSATRKPAIATAAEINLSSRRNAAVKTRRKPLKKPSLKQKKRLLPRKIPGRTMVPRNKSTAGPVIIIQHRSVAFAEP